MGLLRMLFAISVLFYHSGLLFGYNIADNTIAVLSFFVISGFYMALILDVKYPTIRETSLFYSNRLLRIFPLYFLALLGMVTFSSAKMLFHVGGADNAISHYLFHSAGVSPLIFTFNLTNFILRNLTLVITSDYFLPFNVKAGFLLVQQAWTLQIELLFYLVAPFLLRLSLKQMLLFLGFYLISFFVIAEPTGVFLHSSPLYQLLYYLIYFLLGGLSYRYIYSFFRHKPIWTGINWSIFILIVGYLFLYNFIPFRIPLEILHISNSFYFLVLAACLPFVFMLTNKNALDTFIGALSYPVYILHFLVLKFLANLSLFKSSASALTITTLLLTLAISLLAVLFIETPINRFRQSRVKRRQQKIRVIPNFALATVEKIKRIRF